VMFERWMQTGDEELLAQIDEYNREDCIATLLLRDWLLRLRDETVERFGPLPEEEPEAPRPVSVQSVERAALERELREAGEGTAAHLVDYHRREGKPVWWWFFARLEASPEELLEDAESIGGLEPVGEPEQVTKQSKAWTFVFPAQETKLRAGQDVRDPATGSSA